MEVLKALSSIVFLQGIGAGLSFAFVIALTVILGAEGYGLYAWIVSIGSIGGLVVQAGLPMTILKRYAPLDPSATHVPTKLSNTYALYLAVSGALIAAVAVLTSLKTSLHPAVWAFPVATSLATLKIGSAILRSQERPVTAQYTEQVIRVGLVFAALSIGAISGIKALGFYLFAYSCAALIAAAIFLRPLLRYILRLKISPSELIRPNGAHFQVALSRGIANHLPVFITGFYVPPETLAYLAISIQLSGPVGFGLIASRAFYGYRINVAVKSGDGASARHEFRSAIRASNAVSWPLSILLFAALYVSMQWSSTSLPGFESHDLLLAVFGGVLVFRLVLSFFGPAQMVAIFLGNESFVRNANFAILAAFAAGLVAAGRWADIVAVPLIMILYALVLTSAVALKAAAGLRGHA